MSYPRNIDKRSPWLNSVSKIFVQGFINNNVHDIYNIYLLVPRIRKQSNPAISGTNDSNIIDGNKPVLKNLTYFSRIQRRNCKVKYD